MVGGVYKIPIQGRHNNYPHPHVVILEITGAKECVIVPAFSSEGTELAMYVQALVSMGYSADLVCVELDNAKHVTFTGAMTGKPASWLPERYRRIAMRELNAAEKIGTMDSAGLSKIAEGLVKLAAAKPELFSPALVKRIRRLIITAK